MKITSNATLNLKGFEQLRAGLNKGQYVKVGVFGDHKAQRADATINNVELAIIQEFGSKSANIPARSFIRMPIQDKRKDILNYSASKPIADLLKSGDKKKALKLLGVFAENVIQKAFDTGGFGKWAPNAPSTIRKKKSDHPLIDKAELRKAVWSKVVGV